MTDNLLLALCIAAATILASGCSYCDSEADENSPAAGADAGQPKASEAKKSAPKAKKKAATKVKNTPIPSKLAKKQRGRKKGAGASPVGAKLKGPALDPKRPPKVPGAKRDLPKVGEAPAPSKIAKQGKILSLDNTLTRTDVKTATGYRGNLRPGKLGGIEPGLNYNAQRLKPNARDQFGVAIQVWREPNPGAQSRRFNEMLRQYPDSKRSRNIGDSSFTAVWDGLHHIVWLNRKLRFIAAVSCSEPICKNEDATFALAKRVAGKIKKQ